MFWSFNKKVNSNRGFKHKIGWKKPRKPQPSLCFFPDCLKKAWNLNISQTFVSFLPDQSWLCRSVRVRGFEPFAHGAAILRVKRNRKQPAVYPVRKCTWKKVDQREINVSLSIGKANEPNVESLLHWWLSLLDSGSSWSVRRADAGRLTSEHLKRTRKASDSTDVIRVLGTNILRMLTLSGQRGHTRLYSVIEKPADHRRTRQDAPPQNLPCPELLSEWKQTWAEWCVWWIRRSSYWRHWPAIQSYPSKGCRRRFAAAGVSSPLLDWSTSLLWTSPCKIKQCAWLIWLNSYQKSEMLFCGT